MGTDTVHGATAGNAARFRGLGFITIAIGADRYLKQAETLSLSLRRNMPGIPIAIVSDSETMRGYCDVLIPVDHSMPIATAQKLLLDRYSPFEETFFIDSDCIAARDFGDELDEIRRYPITPIVDLLTPIDGTDEYVDDLRAALTKVGGEAFPKFNGGVYYFRRSPVATAVFSAAREYFNNYRHYGLKAFDRGGPGDETVIALALSRLGLLNLYRDGGRLMRTPTGLKGTLEIDPIVGYCSFERYDGLVHPAICHFAGPYLLMPEYRLAAASLRNGKSRAELSSVVWIQATFGAWAATARLLIKYRIDGFKKRLFRALALKQGT
ncbi:hypothetical protein [Paraburkholderia haematera]|uniref:Uncharacterized protein n=1 Tax=Paraburkholderia haematera TaxID=2793077 RepID=A0ABM8RA24_9BURK|nr:hypothetical protein [Paraburkholderia haematera]CAE6741314.1 hypothetical protein R69888_02526 [Paraburkholderia haematera]